MEKGFGISALVIAFLSIAIPVVGPWLSIIVGILVMMATKAGLAFAVAAVVVSIVNLLLLSPSFWVLWNTPNGGIVVPIIWLGSLAAGLVVMIMRTQKAGGSA